MSRDRRVLDLVELEATVGESRPTAAIPQGDNRLFQYR
jgi:hypothetical protein